MIVDQLSGDYHSVYQWNIGVFWHASICQVSQYVDVLITLDSWNDGFDIFFERIFRGNP